MGKLADEAKKASAVEAAEAQLESLEKKLARTVATSEERRREKERLQREAGRLSEQLTAAEDQLAAMTGAVDGIPDPPRWVRAKKRYKKNVATPCLLLSDLHLDEIVDPDVVEGVNGYNRDIAMSRFDRVINHTVDVAKTYTNNLDFEGITVMFGGDILTGDIHEELAATNEGPVADSIVHWTPVLASAVEYLASEFGQVYAPCVRGNHDRYNRKKQHKKSSQEAMSWVIYNWMADRFREDERVEIVPSPSSDFRFPIYDTNFILSHGDQFSGGGGMGGIAGPVKRGQIKKQMRNSSLDRPFDYIALGHFHQLTWGNGFIINGSLKGYDEYAYDHNFEYEKAQQAFWIVAPEKGITMQMPIFAEGNDEGW
jgi:hypothetical protein